MSNKNQQLHFNIADIRKLDVELHTSKFKTDEVLKTKIFDFESFKSANTKSYNVNFARPYDADACLDSGWISKNKEYPLLSIMYINEEDLSRAVRVKMGGNEGKYLWFDICYEDIINLPTKEMSLEKWKSNIEWS